MPACFCDIQLKLRRALCSPRTSAAFQCVSSGQAAHVPGCGCEGPPRFHLRGCVVKSELRIKFVPELAAALSGFRATSARPHLDAGLSDTPQARRQSLSQLLLVLPLFGVVWQDRKPPPDSWHKGLLGANVQAQVLDHLLDVVEGLLRWGVVPPSSHDEGRFAPPKVIVGCA